MNARALAKGFVVNVGVLGVVIGVVLVGCVLSLAAILNPSGRIPRLVR